MLSFKLGADSFGRENVHVRPGVMFPGTADGNGAGIFPGTAAESFVLGNLTFPPKDQS